MRFKVWLSLKHNLEVKKSKPITQIILTWALAKNGRGVWVNKRDAGEKASGNFSKTPQTFEELFLTRAKIMRGDFN